MIKEKVITMYIDDYKRWLSADLEDPALTDELRKIELLLKVKSIMING